ncbi:MAG: trigger factor [Ekhidna sp.]|nr:trigger factor [Ekhidna sp.]
MKISLDKKQKTQGIIKISINRADFQSNVDQKIKKYSKTASIKGFRPGKVPPGIIRKMYGKALTVEEINRLVSDKLNAYLKEEGTSFLGEPIPIQKDEVFDWENAESFEFEYEVGFADSFQIIIDKKLKLDKYLIKIDNQVIDGTIENLRQKFGELEHPEIASERDILHGRIKHESVNQEISLDLRDAEETLVKAATGSRVGDTLEIDLKKDFKEEATLKSQLKLGEDDYGKLKKLKFDIKEINHHKLAVVDQELFEKVFGKDSVKDESSFRKRIKDVVARNYKEQEEQYFDYQIQEKLIENTKITLPEAFLKKWLVKSNESMTPELVELEFSSYTKELQWSLIKNQLIKDNEIKVEHEDVINEAKELVKKQLAGLGVKNQSNDQLAASANGYLQSENGKNYLKIYNQVQNNKVLNFIKEQITIKEKEVTLSEFGDLQN